MGASSELDYVFQWMPTDTAWRRRLRENATKYFRRRSRRQPFRRQDSLPASVERYIGLDNLRLMIAFGFNENDFETAEQKKLADDEEDLHDLKSALKRGGAGRRGSITEIASVDDLRTRYLKTMPKATQVSRDSHRSPSKKAFPTPVCQRCLGINAENLGRGQRYIHSTLARLASARSKCHLCRLIMAKMNISYSPITPTRYRIVLAIEERSGLHELQNRCTTDPDDWDDTRIHLSNIRIEVDDLTPWLKSELGETDNDLFSGYEEGSGLEDDEWRREPKTVHTVSGFYCFTEEHDPARSLVKGLSWIRPVGKTTGSSASFNVAAEWLKRCLAEDARPKSSPATSGGLSPPTSPTVMAPSDGEVTPRAEEFSYRELTPSVELPNIKDEMPSRLLEIKKGGKSVRLIVTGSKRLEYVALSYCWGKDDGGEWKTTTQTVITHMNQGLPCKYLPRTLRHAVKITRRLGFSYIWIDALCIIQDSAKDWGREATKMAGVYFNSVLTIAASAARSWSRGCSNERSLQFHEREAHSDAWEAVESELSTGEHSRLYILSADALRVGEHENLYYIDSWETYHHHLSGAAFEAMVENSPLAKRGWTFQEHQLSRRTLYYTSEQLYWECEHCRCAEDNFPLPQDLRTHPVLESSPLDWNDAAQLWYLRLVPEYSKRVLSFGKDKLIAVSALAKAMYLKRPRPYIAGLWRDSVIDGLMWRRTGPGSKRSAVQCPSWSWASQDSAIEYLWTIPGVQRAKNWLTSYKPEITDMKWEYSSTDSFADVASACIELKTKLTTGAVFYHTHRRNGGQNIQGDSAWNGYTTHNMLYHWKNDTGHIPTPELEQALFISSPTTDTIWYLEAVMDTQEGMWEKVTVAFLGLDNSDREPNPTMAAEQNNNNLVFLLLQPSGSGALDYKRVGIARFRSLWVRDAPYKVGSWDVWKLAHVKEHPMANWEEKTICLV
jgi:hypothetical protein